MMGAPDRPRPAPTGARCALPIPPPVGVDELLRECGRVVVVAPHPDDETLGVGGLLASLLRRHVPVLVILVTDGEASHAADDRWTREALRVARPLECAVALRALGWAQPGVQRLHLPDGAVAAEEALLARQLEPLLRTDDRVFTTWQHDGHPDHEATARAVGTVTEQVGCACTQFPVWSRAAMLRGEDPHALGRMRRFDFDHAVLQRKRRALRAYRSQWVADPVKGTPAVLSPDMVRQFLVPFEVLVL